MGEPSSASQFVRRLLLIPTTADTQRPGGGQEPFVKSQDMTSFPSNDVFSVECRPPRCGGRSLKMNWHYLSAGMRAHAARLSTSMLTVNGEQQIDTKTGQFGLSL